MNVLSLCDGMSCGQIALKELGIKVDRYIAAEIDKNAIKVTKDNFPDTEEVGDVAYFFKDMQNLVLDEEKLKEMPKIDLVIYGSPCFVGDTLVLTQDGYKEIKLLNTDDYVLCHDNKMHKVTDFACTGKKDIVDIKIMGAEKIQTTKNHKFYVRKMYKKYNSEERKTLRLFNEPEWKEVQYLSKDYYVGYAINQESKLPNWSGVELYKYHKKYVSNTLPLDNIDFWYIVGRFLGDGWLMKNYKKSSIKEGRTKYTGIKICCGKAKLEKLRNVVKKIFNYTLIEDRTTYKFQIYNAELGYFLAQFGIGAKNKFVPKFVMDLPIAQLKAFLEGYFDSDGYIHIDDKTNIAKCKCSSISRNLIYGIGQCVAKVYHRPFTIVKHIPQIEGVIEGRKINQRPIYILEFKYEKGKQDKAFYEEGYIWFPIKSITYTDTQENVYDITVEEAHSFTANGMIVHNCRSLSRATAGRERYNKGLEGVSWLFYPCTEILKWIIKHNNADVKFMVENVDSANKTDIGIITSTLGVEPKLINSGDFSAQERKRLYWTNILLEQKPEKNTQVLKDIMETNVEEKYYYNTEFDFKGEDNRVCAILGIKGHDIIKRVYSKYFKAPTLTSCRGGNLQKKVYDNGKCRKLTPIEYRRLQTIPDWYVMNVAASHIYNMCGDGWTIEVIKYIFKSLK